MARPDEAKAAGQKITEKSVLQGIELSDRSVQRAVLVQYPRCLMLIPRLTYPWPLAADLDAAWHARTADTHRTGPAAYWLLVKGHGIADLYRQLCLAADRDHEADSSISS